MIKLTNDARAAAGCPALRANAKLAKAALLHSQDMAAKEYFEHNSLDGRTPWDRIEAQGYIGIAYGENIAWGYTSAADVVAAWMDSPGHRANILDCEFRDIGIGIAQTYWTQDFGGK